MGNHNGITKNNTTLFTDIKYNHYHNKGAKILFEHTYNNYIGFNYIFSVMKK